MKTYRGRELSEILDMLKKEIAISLGQSVAMTKPLIEAAEILEQAVTARLSMDAPFSVHTGWPSD